MDSDSDSDSALSALSLEDAVRRYPTRAVERVAAVLGLVEENFAEFYKTASKYHQEPQVIEKRPQLQWDQTGEDTKRQRLQLRESPQAPIPTVPLSQLLQDPESESFHSNQTRITYKDTSSIEKARARLLDELERPPQSKTPSASYSGSPTVPNTSVPNESQGKPNSQGSQASGRRARRG